MLNRKIRKLNSGTSSYRFFHNVCKCKLILSLFLFVSNQIFEHSSEEQNEFFSIFNLSAIHIGDFVLYVQIVSQQFCGNINN